MKIEADVNEVVLSNVGTVGEFRIRNSAKAFSILSSGLYSNKIRAIVRELSCNAIDSHVAAGKQDVPFEVHLPTALEPWFSVRDFGIGLDNNQVTNIYTTYFESTKTDSNDYIGALGLGSKSPFSYTENFTVTAIKNGTKRIYSAFINEMGVPSIAEMSQELTDEGNGVEVKFSVTEKYDYNSFVHESQSVFKWFKNKPIITGVRFEHEVITYKEENIVPGIHVSASGYASMALMGNIAYPLNKVSEPQKHFGDLAPLLECGLVMEFGIGDLDFAASREELSFVPITIRSIKRKLEELNENLTKHFTEKADAIVHPWARAEYLYEESRSKLYSAAVTKYCANTKFALYDPTSYQGKKTFKFPIKDLADRGLDVTAFHVYSGRNRGKTGKGSEYVNGGYVESLSVPVDTSVVIVLNDLKTGCVARASYHYVNHFSGTALVYCVSHKDEDLATRQLEYDKFTAELHNPPTIVKASTLQKRPVAKREPLSNIGIATLVKKVNTSRYGQDSYKWEPYQSTLDDSTNYYFVCLSNYESETLDGKPFNTELLRRRMSNCGIDDIKNIMIMGVRKTRIKELKDRPNWIWVEEKLKEETAKVSDAHVKAMVAAGILDHWETRPYTNDSIAKRVGKGSDYAKFATECNAIKRASGDVTDLVELCKTYGKSVKVAEVSQALEDAKKLVKAKYPLIKHLGGATEKEIADYVMLIDQQKTI
jgi:hypothetical protein